MLVPVLVLVVLPPSLFLSLSDTPPPTHTHTHKQFHNALRITMQVCHGDYIYPEYIVAYTRKVVGPDGGPLPPPPEAYDAVAWGSSRRTVSTR